MGWGGGKVQNIEGAKGGGANFSLVTGCKLIVYF